MNRFTLPQLCEASHNVGKTTVALSLAKMLSDCGIKTLLIDCDIATNGATYFFETKLERKERYLSLSSLFCSEFEHPIDKMLRVDDNFWFIPSNTSFPNDSHVFPYEDSDIFVKNIDNCQNDFDALIFDCQAGYSKITATVLESSTTNLVVLEPDAISSSSIRVLYAQVSDLIERVKTYQIFNKITDEEYSVYRQIVGGTTFNSLPPIKFNWEVRKAFAFAKVPEMISTNVEFGKNVFEIANILFPKFEEPLFSYTRNILSKEREELELEIKKLEASKYEDWQSDKTIAKKDAYSSLLASTALIAIIIPVFIILVYLMFERDFLFISDTLFPVFSVMLVLVVMTTTAMSSYFRYFRKKRDSERKLQEAKKKSQANFEYEYTKIIKRLDEIEKTIS